MELCQLDKVYVHSLVQYNKVLLQRNKLLKEVVFHPEYEATLDVWDEQLVRFGKEVIKARRDFIHQLGDIIKELHTKLSGGKENIEVIYDPDTEENELEAAVRKSRPQDMKQKTTLAGPHRDDISFVVNGIEIRRFGSQGQQRTAALYLKLSELERVKKGVFLLADKLYGLHFTPNPAVAVYHPDVTAYDVTDAEGRFMAVLYLDFFPRASKNSGAWMTEFRGTKCVDGKETRPLVSLVMNFTKPTEKSPSLLTFDEVETFLHEFGHSLHGMLGEGSYESLTGTNVSRDFVELPSQIMENWATQKEFLDLWAGHYETGEKIPAQIVERIVAAQNYLAAYANVRQLSFGLTDMAWHTLTEPFEGDVEAFEREAMAPAQVLPAVEGTAMSPAFGHIFAGGYASGYYGYKWAEVLEADAFSLFEEKGIFSPEVAASFRDNILSKGGTEDPMELYVRFRGHKPETKALIEKMQLGK